MILSNNTDFNNQDAEELQTTTEGAKELARDIGKKLQDLEK